MDIGVNHDRENHDKLYSAGGDMMARSTDSMNRSAGSLDGDELSLDKQAALERSLRMRGESSGPTRWDATKVGLDAASLATDKIGEGATGGDGGHGISGARRWQRCGHGSDLHRKWGQKGSGRSF